MVVVSVDQRVDEKAAKRDPLDWLRAEKMAVEKVEEKVVL